MIFRGVRMEHHISDINIKSFRGIKNLELKNVNQINILTGDNNNGKTSILEVIQSYQNPADIREWRSLLRRNGQGRMSSDITYYEGFYDLFNINDDEKKIEYSISLNSGENHKVSMSAKESVEEILEKDYGVKLEKYYRVLKVRKANEEMSQLLNCQLGDPVFDLFKLTFDACGNAQYISISLLNGADTYYVMSNDAGNEIKHSGLRWKV